MSDTENAEVKETELSQYFHNMLFLKADITDDKHRQRIIEETLETFGQINILINNAGIPAK